MAKSQKKSTKIEDEMSKQRTDKDAITPEQEVVPELEIKIEEPTIDPMEQLKIEVEQLNDKYLRLNAEFQNYRKRLEKEKTDIYKYGNEKILIDMLPIMDNFERALIASGQENSAVKIIDGVKMVKKSLDELFEKNGVKKIEALNQPFDPIKHHAVMTVEAEAGEGDHVIEIFQDGYVLNDKVIRPSMVKVTH